MDKEVCSCGKSSVTFDCVGEDLFYATRDKAREKVCKDRIEYYCALCGNKITEADRYMMVRH